MPLTLSVQSFPPFEANDVISSVTQAWGANAYPTSMSADGRYLAFRTSEALPGDTDTVYDVYRVDLTTGALVRISAAADGTGGNSNSTAAQLSADGRYAVFVSGATNLGTDGPASQDVFWKDLETGEVRLVSSAQWVGGNAASSAPQISPDGRYVLFESAASNLVPDDTETIDIFLKDMVTNAIVRVSTSATGVGGDDESRHAHFTADGRFVIFESRATNLVTEDTNGQRDIFLKDLATGAITRVSTDANGGQLDGVGWEPRISADGHYAFFTHNQGGGTGQIYRKTLTGPNAGELVPVSVNADGQQGGGTSLVTSISADGRYVMFWSSADNLVPGDTGGEDLFLKDMQTGDITRLTVTADGSETAGPEDDHPWGTISADGRHVVLSSSFPLVPGDADGRSDIFLIDTAYLPYREAISQGRYVEATLAVGAASQVRIA